MDILRIIEELRAERDRLDGIILALERFGREKDLVPGPKRRGRKFMDKKGRQEVSERMKRYWESRRSDGRGPAQNSDGAVADQQNAGAPPDRGSGLQSAA